MKALVLHEPGRLVMEECPVPVPGPGELLIRTKAATICTSDLNDIKHNAFDIALPMIMGHEGAGEVEALGEGVKNFSVGDQITAHPVMPCGKCTSCQRGLSHLCDDMTHLGINKGGVFAEYFCIRADRARKVPQGMSFAMASLMEPVCVCIEAIQRAQVKEGSNVLIIGDGPFGIIIAKLLQSYHPRKVILTGRHPFRMALATGAVTINEHNTQDIVHEIMKASDGEGIDSAILCVGTALAVDTAIASLRSRGTLSVFSAVQPKPAIDLFKVHVKELNICGSCNDMDCLDKALALLQEKDLRMDQIVTHQIPFAQWEKALTLAERGKDEAVKVSMTFSE